MEDLRYILTFLALSLFILAWLLRTKISIFLRLKFFHELIITGGVRQCCPKVKFIFSKKATKINEIFTVDLTLTLCSYLIVKSTVKIWSICVAFLENANFTKGRIHRKCLVKNQWANKAMVSDLNFKLKESSTQPSIIYTAIFFS